MKIRKILKELKNLDGESVFLFLVVIACSVLFLVMATPRGTPRVTVEDEIVQSRTIPLPSESVSAEVSSESANSGSVELSSLGRFRLTVYTQFSDGGKWGYKTATGRRSEHLTTCAVDPKVIPYGTVISIGGEDGLQLIACDCGNFKGKLIDIFYEGTEKEAAEWLSSTFGDYSEIYIVEA